MSSRYSVVCVTFPGLLGGAFGAADSGPDCAHGGSGPTPASETRPSKCVPAHKMYFLGLLESPSSVTKVTL